MAKTAKTTKADVKSVPEIQLYSELKFSECSSSFALEHCYQEISKGVNSLNESHYNNTEKVVDDHLKNKQAQETKGKNIYQNN